METKEYMLFFRFEPVLDYQPSPEDMQQEAQVWGSWIGGVAAEGKLVGATQLGFTGQKVYADKSVQEGIYLADNQTLGGNMVVRVGSIEEAVEISKGCPILTMGGNVEVREVIPM